MLGICGCQGPKSAKVALIPKVKQNSKPIGKSGAMKIAGPQGEQHVLRPELSQRVLGQSGAMKAARPQVERGRTSGTPSGRVESRQ